MKDIKSSEILKLFNIKNFIFILGCLYSYSSFTMAGKVSDFIFGARRPQVSPILTNVSKLKQANNFKIDLIVDFKAELYDKNNEKKDIEKKHKITLDSSDSIIFDKTAPKPKKNSEFGNCNIENRSYDNSASLDISLHEIRKNVIIFHLKISIFDEEYKVGALSPDYYFSYYAISDPVEYSTGFPLNNSFYTKFKFNIKISLDIDNMTT